MAQSILLQERLAEECGVNDFLRRGGERLKRVYGYAVAADCQYSGRRAGAEKSKKPSRQMNFAVPSSLAKTEIPIR